MVLSKSKKTVQSESLCSLMLLLLATWGRNFKGARFFAALLSRPVPLLPLDLVLPLQAHLRLSLQKSLNPRNSLTQIVHAGGVRYHYITFPRRTECLAGDYRDLLAFEELFCEVHGTQAGRSYRGEDVECPLRGMALKADLVKGLDQVVAPPLVF